MAFRSDLRNSNLCAVSLLDALTRKSPDEVTRRLDTAAELGRSAAEDTAEGERIELLNGIAREIRRLAADDRLDCARVYERLLRHLAAPAAEITWHAASIQ